MKYIVTKGMDWNTLWVFTEKEFEYFNEQLNGLPTTTDVAARRFVWHIIGSVTEIEIESFRAEEFINKIKKIPELWKYIEKSEKSDFQIMEFNDYMVKTRGYIEKHRERKDTWVLC